MCKYRKENICNLTNLICPWAYWCGELSCYRERESYKEYCGILKKEEDKVPEGYYRVEFEKRGFLYIEFNDSVIKVKNPFDEVPKFVKVKKTKTSYKLTK